VIKTACNRLNGAGNVYGDEGLNWLNWFNDMGWPVAYKFGVIVGLNMVKPAKWFRKKGATKTCLV
jgi:hypothetical protein